MKLSSNSFADGAPIPGRFAMGIPADDGPATFGKNVSPHLAWSDVPDNTRSFALLCHDPDVPSKPDDVNKADREVPADLPRVDFFHWVLVDIKADVRELAEGADSNGVEKRGKQPGPTGNGVRGINNYTNWFQGDADMGGNYGGYDGPFPPWNDSILHHYVFTLYALDVETLGLEGIFGGPEVRKAVAGHVLAEATWTGTYSLNPRVTG